MTVIPTLSLHVSRVGVVIIHTFNPFPYCLLAWVEKDVLLKVKMCTFFLELLRMYVVKRATFTKYLASIPIQSTTTEKESSADEVEISMLKPFKSGKFYNST